jgi:hypothetical protein
MIIFRKQHKGWTLLVNESEESWSAVVKFKHPNIGWIDCYDLKPHDYTINLRHHTVKEMELVLEFFEDAPFVRDSELMNRYKTLERARQIGIL